MILLGVLLYEAGRRLPSFVSFVSSTSLEAMRSMLVVGSNTLCEQQSIIALSRTPKYDVAQLRL